VTALVAYRSDRRAQDALVKLYAARPVPEIHARFDSARALNPDSVIDTSEALFLTKEPERARRILERALGREPENVQLWLALSQVEVKRRDDAAAREAYDHARRLDSQLPAQ
jgi:predicted Zn-dependent protease